MSPQTLKNGIAFICRDSLLVLSPLLLVGVSFGRDVPVLLPRAWVPCRDVALIPFPSFERFLHGMSYRRSDRFRPPLWLCFISLRITFDYLVAGIVGCLFNPVPSLASGLASVKVKEKNLPCQGWQPYFARDLCGRARHSYRNSAVINTPRADTWQRSAELGRCLPSGCHPSSWSL